MLDSWTGSPEFVSRIWLVQGKVFDIVDSVFFPLFEPPSDAAARDPSRGLEGIGTL